MIKYRSDGDYCEFPSRLVIGMDPEFLLLTKGNRLFPAHQLMSSSRGRVGLDTSGSDTGELRPKEGTPKEIKKNMRELYKQLNDKIKESGRDLRVFSGSHLKREGDIISLGGHIHFNIEEDYEFIRILQAFIGDKLVRGKLNDRWKADRNYGNPHDYNDKSYGFEYRTPPSFIGKPEVFDGVVAVAYCLAKTWVKHCKTSNHVWSFNEEPTLGDYKKLVCYSRYKKDIDFFFKFTKKKKTLREFDALAAWEIKKPIAAVSV